MTQIQHEDLKSEKQVAICLMNGGAIFLYRVVVSQRGLVHPCSSLPTQNCEHSKLVDASAHLISVLSFVQIQHRVPVRTNLPILMLFVTVLPMRRSSL
jgi:hypothetical protein